MDKEIIKYYDWYYSTGRRTVVAAQTVGEAMSYTPMALPDLSVMQKELMERFPYDLWE